MCVCVSTLHYRDDMKRDPTNVELFDIAQSNSEHSRHWFFRGKIVIDGQEMPENLFNIVKTPWKVRCFSLRVCACVRVCFNRAYRACRQGRTRVGLIRDQIRTEQSQRTEAQDQGARNAG